MRTVTVRDLRQRWPELESALAQEGEIVVTRDGTPVARLLSYVPVKERRRQFTENEQIQWVRKVWGKKKVCWVDPGLAQDRNE